VLIQLTRNVRHLWQAPQRTNEERKRLLQAVVSEVILQRADRETADLEIVWKGGLRQVLTVRRLVGSMRMSPRRRAPERRHSRLLMS